MCPALHALVTEVKARPMRIGHEALINPRVPLVVSECHQWSPTKDCGALESLWLLLQEGAPTTPADVANAILDALPETFMIAERPMLAGPGFINVKLNPDWVAERIHNMLMRASLNLPPHRQSNTISDNAAWPVITFIKGHL